MVVSARVQPFALRLPGRDENDKGDSNDRQIQTVSSSHAFKLETAQCFHRDADEEDKHIRLQQHDGNVINSRRLFQKIKEDPEINSNYFRLQVFAEWD
jgi:hypothetical protein